MSHARWHRGQRGPDPEWAVDTSKFENSKDFTEKGFPRDYEQFWRAWIAKRPETMSDVQKKLASGTNPKTGRSQQPIAPTVDEEWLKSFPEQRPYKGDKLVHHHEDQGAWAIPVPSRTHPGSGGPFHGFPEKKK